VTHKLLQAVPPPPPFYPHHPTVINQAFLSDLSAHSLAEVIKTDELFLSL